MLNTLATDLKNDVSIKSERAVRISIIALIFMLAGAFSMFTIVSTSSYVTTIRLNELAFALALGSCIFLFLQDSGKYKVYSIILLFVSAFVSAFSLTYFNVHSTSMIAPNVMAIFRYIGFVSSLRSSVIMAVVVLVITLVIAVTSKKEIKRKLNISVLVCAIAVIICRLFFSGIITSQVHVPLLQARSLIAGGIIFAIAMILFSLIIYTICTVPSYDIITGTGTKIWFNFCIVVNIILIIVGLVTRTTSILNILVVVVFIIGYILLLRSNRIGFPLVLLTVVFSVLVGINVAISISGGAGGNIIYPLFGVINPLITWLLIRNNWRNSNIM